MAVLRDRQPLYDSLLVLISDLCDKIMMLTIESISYPSSEIEEEIKYQEALLEYWSDVHEKLGGRKIWYVNLY